MAPKKTIAKKAPAKKAPAKKASPAKKSSAKKSETAMLFAPELGSDLDLKVRIKAVIAVLQDSPVSDEKAGAAAEILEGVLTLL